MHIYMESRNMVLINLFAGQQWRKRQGEQIYGCGGGEKGEGEMHGDGTMETHSTMRKTGSQQEFAPTV